MLTNDEPNDDGEKNEVEEEVGINDDINAIFRLRQRPQQTKTPNDSFDTGLTGTSFDDDEEEEDPVLYTKKKVTIENNDNSIVEEKTIKASNSKESKTKNERKPTTTPKTEITTDESLQRPWGSYEEEEEHKDKFEDHDEGFYNIYCSSRKECDDDDDDQSDASEITVPSFRLGSAKDQSHDKRGIKSFFTKLAKQTVQKAFQRSVSSIGGKKKHKQQQQQHANNNNNNDSLSSPVTPCRCSCLLLLMEPSSHTFEIIPVVYYPNESYVSDLLEQIPLQSTFNFRLRFQNYTGLLSLSHDGPCHQLVQSKPVPVKYSCEYHRYVLKQQPPPTPSVAAAAAAAAARGDEASSSSNIMMPLVAILPEKIVSTGCSDQAVNMIDVTERYARKLLSDRNVLEKIKVLQSIS
jgi:hypothetical protein